MKKKGDLLVNFQRRFCC